VTREIRKTLLIGFPHGVLTARSPERAFDVVGEVRPNGVTRMLAVQMVCVQVAIVEFLSRATAP